MGAVAARGLIGTLATGIADARLFQVFFLIGKRAVGCGLSLPVVVVFQILAFHNKCVFINTGFTAIPYLKQ